MARSSSCSVVVSWDLVPEHLMVTIFLAVLVGVSRVVGSLFLESGVFFLAAGVHKVGEIILGDGVACGEIFLSSFLVV